MSTQAAAPESTCPVFLALHQPRAPAMPTHRDAHPVFPSRKKSVVSYVCLATPGEVRTTGGNDACSGIYMVCRYLSTLQSAGRQTSGFHGQPQARPLGQNISPGPMGMGLAAASSHSVFTFALSRGHTQSPPSLLLSTQLLLPGKPFLSCPPSGSYPSFLPSQGCSNFSSFVKPSFPHQADFEAGCFQGRLSPGALTLLPLSFHLFFPPHWMSGT